MMTRKLHTIASNCARYGLGPVAQRNPPSVRGERKTAWNFGVHAGCLKTRKAAREATGRLSILPFESTPYSLHFGFLTATSLLFVDYGGHKKPLSWRDGAV